MVSWFNNDSAQVLDIETGVWRDCKILGAIDIKLNKVKIHFNNFASKHDCLYDLSN